MAVSEITATSPLVMGKAVLFDMDGTLVDHFRALYRCYRFAAEGLGREPPTLEAVRAKVGGSMPVTIQSFFAEDEVKRAIELWNRHFDEIHLQDVKLLPGARELLDTLQQRGIRRAVFTNKSGRHTRAILENQGIDGYFDFALGAEDSPYRKPQRAFSEMAIQRIGLHAEQILLVGDSPFDIDAASVVGMSCACVTTGTHTAAELRNAGCKNVFANLLEINQAFRSRSSSDLSS